MENEYDHGKIAFDIPVTELAAYSTRQLHEMCFAPELIASLKGKQTVLIVAHDPELIQRRCSHVLVIDAGKCQA